MDEKKQEEPLYGCPLTLQLTKDKEDVIAGFCAKEHCAWYHQHSKSCIVYLLGEALVMIAQINMKNDAMAQAFMNAAMKHPTDGEPVQ